LERRYSVAARAELHFIRMTYMALGISTCVLGFCASEGAQALSFGVMAGVASTLVWAYNAASPARAEKIAFGIAVLLIVALAARQTMLMAECGGCPDLVTFVGVMPFVHTAVISPRCVTFAPVLVAHAVYAAKLLLTSAATNAVGKAATMVLCVLIALGHLYVSELARMERVLGSWRLERAMAERAVAQAHAASKDMELIIQRGALRQQTIEREAGMRARFLKWVCHEIRNPITGVVGSLDVLLLRPDHAALSGPQRELLANARTCAESITRVSKRLVLCHKYILYLYLYLCHRVMSLTRQQLAAAAALRVHETSESAWLPHCSSSCVNVVSSLSCCCAIGWSPVWRWVTQCHTVRMRSC
jgi:signal transduction histidine kinase